MSDHMETGLKCDIELNVIGPNSKVTRGWISAALRQLADEFEKEQFHDGFAPIKDGAGKEIGQVYFDYYDID